MATKMIGGYMSLVITDIEVFRKIASTADKTALFGKKFEQQRSEFVTHSIFISSGKVW